jgi:hypothetical protein
LPSAKNEPAGDATELKWGGFGVSGAGRLFLGQTTKIVPVGVLSFRSTNSDFGSDFGKIKFMDLNLGLGVGLNHELNESNTLVMALEVLGIQSSAVDSSDIEVGEGGVKGGKIGYARVTLPGLYLGAESKIRPWLTGRLGAAQVYQAYATVYNPEDGPDEKSSYTNSQFNMSFGLGFNFADFTLDAAINEGLFFDGPNFISGSTEQMANRLSLTYKF